MRQMIALWIAGMCLLASTAVGAEGQKAVRADKVMGMPVEITVWATDATACARALDLGFAELYRIEQLFSVYRLGSQVNEINQFASRRPVVVSPEVMGVLQWAQKISGISNGAFDITVAGYAWEYGFGQGDYRVPTNARLEQIKAWVGYKNVMLIPADKTVLFKHDGVQIDLGGIAKSHALNTVRGVLKKAGVQAAMINAGGDVAFVNTKPEGGAWRVGVKNPRDPRQLLTVVDVFGGKVLSSGDYERFFEQDGVRYHHIIDAATGKPSQYAMAATLWLPENSQVDLPSVTLMLMPPDKALALVQAIPGAEALIVDAEKKAWMTPGWNNKLKITW
jgi:thiamine biosynthesis lipoprotein